MADDPNNPNPKPEGSIPPRADDAGHDPEKFREQLTRVTVPPELDKAENRSKWKLEDPNNGNRGPYLIELNVQHVGGLPGAAAGFVKIYRELFGQSITSGPQDDLYEDTSRAPAKIGKGYYRCYLQVKEWRRLVAEDE